MSVRNGSRCLSAGPGDDPPAPSRSRQRLVSPPGDGWVSPTIRGASRPSTHRRQRGAERGGSHLQPVVLVHHRLQLGHAVGDFPALLVEKIDGRYPPEDAHFDSARTGVPTRGQLSFVSFVRYDQRLAAVILEAGLAALCTLQKLMMCSSARRASR